MKKLFSVMSNLETHHHLKLGFQNLDKHIGGKWLIHDTEYHKDNQLESLSFPLTMGAYE